ENPFAFDTELEHPPPRSRTPTPRRENSAEPPARPAAPRRNRRLAWMIGASVGLTLVVLMVVLIFLPGKPRNETQAAVQTPPKPPSLSLPAKVELPPDPIVSLPRDEPKAAATPDGSLSPATLKKVKDATVFISVNAGDGESLTGSGFLALGPGLIVTNAH